MRYQTEVLRDGVVGAGMTAGDCVTTVECFAKLYRRHNHHHQLRSNSENNDSSGSGHRQATSFSQLLDHRYSSLPLYISPGEWVQVHINGGVNNDQVFLKECSTPPCIERNHDGFPYTMVCNSSAAATTEACLNVHCGPSLQASIAGELVLPLKQPLLVSEKVYCYQRQETWLRLKSGKGWVSTVGHDGHTLLIQQAAASPYRPKNGANVCSNSSNSIDSSVEHSHRMVRQILKIGPHHHAGH